jgi:iron complex outermembrane receptor protein
MKTCISHARLAVLPLALAAAFSAFAQAQTLPSVVVTATRFADTASNLPFGVSVISADEIKRSGVTTVNDAIMKLLGVPGRLDFYGGGDYALDLRGFGTTAGSNQVVIVDGLRMNEADQGGTRLAGIPIDSVDRIEVLRGSGAVLYGEGATGGVIVITTKAGRGVARKNAAEIYTAAGSLGLAEVRATGTLVAGGFSVDLAANKRQADNHRDNFKSDVRGDSVVGQWSNDWLRLGARHVRDALNTGLPGSLTAAQYQANPVQTLSSNKTARINNAQDSVFAEATLGNWLLGLDAGSRTKSLDSLTSGIPTYQYVIDANTLALRAKHEAKFGLNANALVFGFDQVDWIRKTLGTFGSVAFQKTNAVYVKNDITLPGGTRLSAGLRTQAIQQSIAAANPTIDNNQNAWELGLTQPLAPGWIGYGRVGSSFRLANVDDLGFTTPGAVLLPQTSRDIELGSRWSYEGGRAELRLYRSELNNEIGYDPTIANANAYPYPGFGANVNFDPTVRQGLELETRHELSKTVGVGLNAGWRQARFVAGVHNGNTVPLVPQTTIALRADWTPLPGHRLNGGLNWVSSQNPDFANLCTMPAYTTVDARYAYQYKNAEFALGINNLTDSKYYTQAFDCSKAGVTESIYPEAGRTFTASVRVRF